MCVLNQARTDWWDNEAVVYVASCTGDHDCLYRSEGTQFSEHA